MPGRDGTGPIGNRPGLGIGGRGRQDGYCICPKCGEKKIHVRGIPCNNSQCPKCGARMIRGD